MLNPRSPSAEDSYYRRGVQKRTSRMTAGEFTWIGAQRVQLLEGWEWMITPHLQHMECYFDQAARRIGMSEQTWGTLQYANGTEEVSAMAKNGVSGMTFLVTDVGPFSRSLLAEAKHLGRDVPGTKDPITQIEEKANALLVQAAGMNGATPVQMEIFTVRFAEMQREFTALQERMDRVAGVVQLAGLAVAEAV